jgi:hypothetical protein
MPIRKSNVFAIRERQLALKKKKINLLILKKKQIDNMNNKKLLALKKKQIENMNKKKLLALKKKQIENMNKKKLLALKKNKKKRIFERPDPRKVNVLEKI